MSRCCLALLALLALPACTTGAVATPPCEDRDGDGSRSPACGGDDCDDGDPTVRPGAAESCDGVDQDCDGLIDEDCACNPGDRQTCSQDGVDPFTRNKGICADGHQDCLPDGTGWGTCQGAVTPTPEGPVCDGIDQDCDGVADQDTRNACGTCGPVSPEICGNGLDDDCNGSIDDPSICSLNCGSVDVSNPPPGFECCAKDHPDCQQIDCEGRLNQPCYSGPPQTAGKGICHGGNASCLPTGAMGQQEWSSCDGEQKPLPEVCGNGLDDDCDGVIDEDDGLTHLHCPPPDCPGGGPERCGDGVDSSCNGFGGPGEPEDPGCCVPAGDETCNGFDDDCDGLVDEGVVNVCGKCAEETCFTEEEHEPANCVQGSDRICSRIIPDANNPDGFTLSQDLRGSDEFNVLYAAVVDRKQVARLDTISGQKLWQVDSLGDSPGPLAVQTDSSVWVVNQGLGDPLGVSLVHLDRDGNVYCRSLLPGPAAGLAIHPDDYSVWVGRFDPPEVRAYAAWATAGIAADGFPLCAQVQDPIALTEPVARLAITSKGILWTASLGDRTVRLDTASFTSEVIHHGGSTLDVALDPEDAPWFAGSSAHRIAADGPYLNPTDYEKDLGFEADSVAADARQLSFVDGATLTLVDLGTQDIRRFLVPRAFGVPAGGITEDDQGKVWMLLETGRAATFDPMTEQFDDHDVDLGHQLAAYGSDASRPFPSVGTRMGTWEQILDSGYPSTIWTQLEWTELRPYGTVVSVYASFAPTLEELDRSAHCKLTGSPADLRGCPGSRRARFAAIHIALTSSHSGSKPMVSNVRISSTRP